MEDAKEVLLEMKDGGFLLGGFLSFVFDDHSNGVGDQFVRLQINKNDE